MIAPLLLLLPICATAQTGHMALTTPDVVLDGDWMQVPDDVQVSNGAMVPGPPSHADIVAMADLDGNPDIITAQEREMIAVLNQLLGGQPITW
ncbi:hypothetical protein [Loktanella fryxellensis]|uniref:hypothetical protein n=1 Tax=Loktanella fryxellensis TaxID=245187 RepID=UPI00115FD262|nr:hypothetical protein [Loktanella fryxellensis]